MAEKKFEPEGLFFVFVVPPKRGDPKEFHLYTPIQICFTEEDVAAEQKRWKDVGIETHCVRVALEGNEISIKALSHEERYFLLRLAEHDNHLRTLYSLMFKAIFAERLMRQAVNSSEPEKT